MDQKDKKEIMDLLVEEKIMVLEGGPFLTSSGVKVPFYADFRKIASNPYALDKISNIFSKKIIENKIDIIAGIETTGIPFATAISMKSKKKMVWLRKNIRDHGKKTVISGLMPKNNEKIAVFDDSVGSGDSLNLTIENLEREKYNIDLFLTIMEGNLMDSLKDRKEYLENKGIKYFFVCTMKEWVDYVFSKGELSQKLKEYFYKFIENPLSFDDNSLEQYKDDLKKGEI